MRLKIIILVVGIIALLSLSLFSFGLKDIALKGIADEVPEYNCNGGICTSCIFEGNTCSCGQEVCSCGNLTVEKEECNLF